MDPSLAAISSTLISGISTEILMYASYHWPAGRNRVAHREVSSGSSRVRCCATEAVSTSSGWTCAGGWAMAVRSRPTMAPRDVAVLTVQRQTIVIAWFSGATQSVRSVASESISADVPATTLATWATVFSDGVTVGLRR